MSRALTLVLFDDELAAAWHPFTLTRPAGELLFGARTLRARAEAWTGTPCAGHIAAGLRGFDESGARPVLDPASLPADTDRLFLCARAAVAGPRFVPTTQPSLLVSGERILGFFCPAQTPAPPPAVFERPSRMADAGWPRLEISARVLVHVWDLVIHNSAQLIDDLANAPDAGLTELAPHVLNVEGGRARARVGRDVRIEPGVIIDATNGGVWFDDRVHVRAFTRIAGPCYFGPGTTVLGGSLTAVSVGPACKVRGELEESVIQGWSNKAHDGFIGHACIGRWVNLGANTTNSDLKNNYGSVRVWTPAGERDTGERKIGCFIGDHAKTAIGTLLNTGTVIGPCANLFGTSMPPKYVRPFSWGGGLSLHELERFLDTARIVMGRRGETLSAGSEQILRALWMQIAGRVA